MLTDRIANRSMRNVKEFRRVDDGVVYVLGVNGTLWREGPAPLPTADLRDGRCSDQLRLGWFKY
jgi:hypothetical protein